MELEEQFECIRQATSGQMPPGAQPGPFAPMAASVPAAAASAMTTGGSIEEMTMQADQLAQTFLTMDPTARRSALINLSKQNEVLHALVKARLEDLEQQAQTTGVQLVRTGQIPIGQ